MIRAFTRGPLVATHAAPLDITLAPVLLAVPAAAIRTSPKLLFKVHGPQPFLVILELLKFHHDSSP
jgi:hypothetical protein